MFKKNEGKGTSGWSCRGGGGGGGDSKERKGIRNNENFFNS